MTDDTAADKPPAAEPSPRAPSLLDALIPLVTLIGLIVLTIALFGTDATSGPLQVALLTSAVVAGLVAFKNGFSAARIREAAVGGVSSGMSALFILLAVGALIGTWNMAGTIPTVVYYGLGLLSATWFYPATAIVCGLVGLAIGSSWTTAATLGVAFVALAPLVGADPAITAGAVISGAYFGDKMTPVSETTVLVPSMVGGVTTNEHIGAMVWTSGPFGRHRAGAVHDPRPHDAGDGTWIRSGQRAGDAGQRVLDRPPQPAAARPARHLLDPARPAVPGDLQLCALRRRTGVVHPARTRDGVRQRARPGTGADGDRGDLRGDGDRLRVHHGQRDHRHPLLPRRDGRHADDDLAHPRGAELRRDHGGGGFPRSADHADRRPSEDDRPAHRGRRSARASA